MSDERVDERADFSVHGIAELMQRHTDAVIGDAVLREIVGANFFGAIAGADLSAAFGSNLLVLLIAFQFVQDARGERAWLSRGF